MTAPRRPPGRSTAGTGGGCDGQLRSRPRSRSSDAAPPPGHRNRHPRSPPGGASSLHGHGYQIICGRLLRRWRPDALERAVPYGLKSQSLAGRCTHRAPPGNSGRTARAVRSVAPVGRSPISMPPPCSAKRVRGRCCANGHSGAASPGTGGRGVPVGPLGGRPPRRPSRNITSPTKTAPSPISAPAPPRQPAAPGLILRGQLDPLSVSTGGAPRLTLLFQLLLLDFGRGVGLLDELLAA